MAGSLKRELKSKHGIEPKMTFAHGELELLVEGRSIFSYKREHRTLTVNELVALIESAA